MDAHYEESWVFITRYTQSLPKRIENKENEDELIEDTIERAKEVLSGSIVNMIGLNQDLQKVFKELSTALNAVDAYNEWLSTDKTNVETLLGEND